MYRKLKLLVPYFELYDLKVASSVEEPTTNYSKGRQRHVF